MTGESLAEDFEVPHSKTFDGIVYQVHKDSRNNPYGYWGEKEAEGAANRLRSLGWSVRLVKHGEKFGKKYPIVIYKRKK